MPDKVASITDEIGDVGFVPAAPVHPGGEAAHEAKTVDPAFEDGSDEAMISVKDGHGLVFIQADQDDGANAGFLLEEPGADVGDLFNEGVFPVALPGSHLVDYGFELEISSRNLSPMGSGKDANLIEVGFGHLGFVPFDVGGKLVPEGAMPQKEEGPTLGTFALAVEVGGVDHGSQRLVIFTVGDIFKVALDELGDNIIFGDSANEANGARPFVHEQC